MTQSADKLDGAKPSDMALLPGLREALKWKPNTPQLENAMTYAWEQALKSFIRALEASAPLPESGRIEVEEQWGRQQRIELLELALEQYAMRPGADGEIARIALKGATPLSAIGALPSSCEGYGVCLRHACLSAGRCTISAQSASEDNLAASLAVKLAKAAYLLAECVEGTVGDCTDWNRRVREFLQDSPRSTSGLPDPGTEKLLRDLLDRGYKMHVMAGTTTRLSEQDADQNDPLLAWLSDCRSVLYGKTRPTPTVRSAIGKPFNG